MATELLLGDPKYLEHGNDLKMCIDQITMLLMTIPGEVLGDPEYGIDLKKYLWELQFSGQEMKNYIQGQINKYVRFSDVYAITVEVRLIDEDVTTSAFIDILINDVPVLGIHVK